MRFGPLRTAFRDTILWSEDPHVKGVGLILSRVAADSLLAWAPVSKRIITARFASKYQNMSVFQVYASTKDVTDEGKEALYH